MGSAPVGVRCQFHQLPPTSSVRRHLTQFLKGHPAPLDNVVQPFPVWSSSLVCVLNSSKHQRLYLPVVVHSTYVPKQSQFSAYQFLHLKWVCLNYQRKYQSPNFTGKKAHGNYHSGLFRDESDSKV